MLDIIDTGISSAEENMALDINYLQSLEKKPILHFYDWKGPSATYGYFIRPEKFLDLKSVEKYGISLSRRPTGGGIVFHVWDYAFSFLMPSSHPFYSLNTLDNYRFVNEIVLSSIKNVFSISGPLELISHDYLSPGADCQHFCMAKPTQYDVVYKGVKIAGAAQRRTSRGYLHQGTISLGFPKETWLKDLLLSQESVWSAMASYSFAPLGKEYSKELLHKTRNHLKEKLAQDFRTRFL
jgi:lipoate-protein ligase A